jgi:hypothetical protein
MCKNSSQTESTSLTKLTLKTSQDVATHLSDVFNNVRDVANTTSRTPFSKISSDIDHPRGQHLPSIAAARTDLRNRNCHQTKPSQDVAIHSSDVFPNVQDVADGTSHAPFSKNNCLPFSYNLAINLQNSTHELPCAPSHDTELWFT